MKRIIYTAIFLSASWLTGCQEAEYLLFNDIARVQMDEEDEIRTSFYYTDASINRRSGRPGASYCYGTDQRIRR